MPLQLPPQWNRPPKTPNKKATKLVQAADQAATAQTTAFRAIETLASVAKNQSDRGAIATMAEYIYRPLKRKAEELCVERAKKTGK
jgi:hypothetical protein